MVERIIIPKPEGIGPKPKVNFGDAFNPFRLPSSEGFSAWAPEDEPDMLFSHPWNIEGRGEFFICLTSIWEGQGAGFKVVNTPMDLIAEFKITDGLDVENTLCHLILDEEGYFSQGFPVDQGKCAEFSEWIDMDGDLCNINVNSVGELSGLSVMIVQA